MADKFELSKDEGVVLAATLGPLNEETHPGTWDIYDRLYDWLVEQGVPMARIKNYPVGGE